MTIIDPDIRKVEIYLLDFTPIQTYLMRFCILWEIIGISLPIEVNCVVFTRLTPSLREPMALGLWKGTTFIASRTSVRIEECWFARARVSALAMPLPWTNVRP